MPGRPGPAGTRTRGTSTATVTAPRRYGAIIDAGWHVAGLRPSGAAPGGVSSWRAVRARVLARVPGHILRDHCFAAHSTVGGHGCPGAFEATHARRAQHREHRRSIQILMTWRRARGVQGVSRLNRGRYSVRHSPLIPSDVSMLVAWRRSRGGTRATRFVVQGVRKGSLRWRPSQGARDVQGVNGPREVQIWRRCSRGWWPRRVRIRVVMFKG